jgi:hypothetical protein
MKKTMSRRQCIKGLGGFSLTLPFLPSLLPSSANAASAPPKRFAAVCNFDGYYEKVYYPSLDADQKFADDVYYRALSSIPGDLSENFGAYFNALKSKMNIYRGLDIPGSVGHSSANALCGAARITFGDDAPLDLIGNSRSVDVILGKSPNFYPTSPEFLALRGQEPSYDYSVSYDRDSAGKTFRIPFKTHPKDMFQQVFGNRILDPNLQTKFKAKKVMIGDLVLEDYKALMNNQRISRDDKSILDNFITMLQDLNTRMNQQTVITCSKPAAPTAGPYWDALSEAEKAGLFTSYIDMMVAAMACDITRVGVLSLRIFGHDHGLSHGNPSDRNNQLAYIANNQKIVKIVAEFATKMNQVIEADGTTMLDNSILFWGMEDSQGPAHRCESMPSVSFGSAANKIKTGYYMDYRQRPLTYIAGRTDFPAMGRSYSQLLITFMKALGLQPNEYLPYGDGGGFGTYNNNPTYSEGRYLPYEKFRNDTLPFISLV